MRQLKENKDGTFRVKAYAGTNGVLVAMDLDEAKKPGLLGFAIEQKEGDRNWQFLLNSLTFPGKTHTLTKWNATPSNLAPIQKFRWADYSIEPNTTCKYRVYPAYGTPDKVRLEDPLEVTVTTNDGMPSDHHVAFNRAVAASQSFERKFPEMVPLLNEKPGLPIEGWPDAPRRWLEHGLLDRILDFMKRATDKTWALDVAIYEYELGAIVEGVDAAHDRGVNVRVLYHAKNNDEQTHENEKSLAKIPDVAKRARVTSKIFHNKFIVLSKIDGAGVRTPQAVLCGSTNFTENGVYRQANVVHETDNKALAASYLATFENIWAAPANVGSTRKWLSANNLMAPGENFFAGFSPRTGEGDLDEFVNIIKAADKDVLFATAFNLPERILDALLGANHDSVLRFGIQNTASRITGFHADRTADFAAPALINSGLEGWVKEGLKGQRGRLLVHLKAIVTNFTTDNPIILSGSHNLSVPASSGNDENYLIVRGNTDLADRYGIEILRFYEHYRFRYYAKKLKLTKVDPLKDSDVWADDAYQDGHLKQLSRVRFAGR
jgi:phosphatidylserine/phosphatidylglycerophosphate/cardiolipin synthase-like enzyme